MIASCQAMFNLCNNIHEKTASSRGWVTMATWLQEGWLNHCLQLKGCVIMQIHNIKHNQTHTHMHARTHACTHVHTRTHMHTRTHTHTQGKNQNGGYQTQKYKIIPIMCIQVTYHLYVCSYCIH